MAAPEIEQPVPGVTYGVFVFTYLYASEFIEFPWWLFWAVTSGFVIVSIIYAVQNTCITELAIDDTHAGNN